MNVAIAVLLVAVVIGGALYARSKSRKRRYHAGQGNFGPRDVDG